MDTKEQIKAIKAKLIERFTELHRSIRFQAVKYGTLEADDEDSSVSLSLEFLNEVPFYGLGVDDYVQAPGKIDWNELVILEVDEEGTLLITRNTVDARGDYRDPKFVGHCEADEVENLPIEVIEELVSKMEKCFNKPNAKTFKID